MSFSLTLWVDVCYRTGSCFAVSDVCFELSTKIFGGSLKIRCDRLEIYFVLMCSQNFPWCQSHLGKLFFVVKTLLLFIYFFLIELLLAYFPGNDVGCCPYLADEIMFLYRARCNYCYYLIITWPHVDSDRGVLQYTYIIRFWHDLYQVFASITFV